MTVLERDCVIVGGGPAGMVLGYLLARSGLRVTVLEKHADFLRDFRGDTIHPSTLTVLGELGLRERFLELPVDLLRTLDVVVEGERITAVDFATLSPPDNRLAFAPQWEFLDFLARESAAYPGFELRRSTAATGLVFDQDHVVGLVADGPEGELALHAPLVVAADGRASALRSAAGLTPRAFGVPIDVLWFDLPKPDDPPPPTLGYLDSRGMVLTIDRGTRYQSGLVIPKGGHAALLSRGLEALRAELVAIAPVLAPVIATLTEWDQVKLLSVQLDRLETWWRPGFIAIGDAAHAMSPVGGVGINFAVQDAVALANVVAAPLAAGSVDPRALAAVQRRRLRPVRVMHAFQRAVHRRLDRGRAHRHVFPAPVRFALRHATPVVQRVAARVIGLGFLPEHVRPELRAAPPD